MNETNDFTAMLLAKSIKDALDPALADVLKELESIRKQAIPALRAVSDIYKQMEEIKRLAVLQRDAVDAVARAGTLEKENKRLRQVLGNLATEAATAQDSLGEDRE